MSISIFDLFKVGIGPSSSHTVGPMVAARDFTERLGAASAVVAEVRVELFGSLAATGRGHGTFGAVLLGLEGHRPDALSGADVEAHLRRIEAEGRVRLTPDHAVPLRESDFVLRPLTVLARHSNAMKLVALDGHAEVLADETYYSVGGGFVVREGEDPGERGAQVTVPYPFETAAELLQHCAAAGIPISEVMRGNELARRTGQELADGVAGIRAAMRESVQHSLTREGVLPGGLEVRRRARTWHERLLREAPDHEMSHWQEWVNLIALAVNEENASGGRIVTAPTNGAAGIIPAVLYYLEHFVPAVADGTPAERDAAVERFFLTAAAIGVLFKSQASISGAEVGCQGEVGSASSMAAAGLAEALGGTPEQVANAAEIAMEHSLGLTCDPIGGLVQIPCIERNAIAAAKAINAAKMALWGDGLHHVTLDEVIVTMRETGRDMSDKYKETALGGLAVNVAQC